MKVVIPVAGVGNRLKPHTITTPKPLLKVGNKAILDHLLEPLIDLNPEEVIFVIGYKGEQITKHVREKYDFKSTFVMQDKLLGLGYALHMAMEHVHGEPLLVILGDTIVDCDLVRFTGAGDYVLGVRKVENPQRFGIAEIEEGFVSDLVEKPDEPKSDLALIGLYYFSDHALLKKELAQLVASGKTTSGEIQLTDALDAMIKNGVKFKPFEVHGWFDCGKKETILTSHQHLLSKLARVRSVDGSIVNPPVHIADNVRIQNAIVGPNVSVDEGSVILDSIVTNSIIGRNVRIEKMILDESIVGNDAVIIGEKKVVSVGESTEIGGL